MLSRLACAAAHRLTACQSENTRVGSAPPSGHAVTGSKRSEQRVGDVGGVARRGRRKVASDGEPELMAAGEPSEQAPPSAGTFWDTYGK